jgi:hypothetical protein
MICWNRTNRLVFKPFVLLNFFIGAGVKLFLSVQAYKWGQINH